MKTIKSKYIQSFLIFCVALVLSCPLVFGATDKDAKALYENALNFSQKKDWDNAVAEFLKAAELAPKDSLIQANLGVAFSQTGKYKQALLSFEKALRLGYDSPGLRYNRGVSFARVKLLDEAVHELETALKMDHRMVRAEYDLGVLYNLQGKREKALEKVDTLFKRNNKLSKKLFDQIDSPYTVVSVDNGGTLKGRVTLSGPVPRVRSFHLIHAPNIEFCSRISDGKGHRLLFDFTVSRNRGLKDTVIHLVNVEKGKPFYPKMQIFHIDRCRANKYVIGAQNGENIMVENTDPIQHEIATYEVRNIYSDQTSNRPLPEKSSQVRSVFVRKDAEEFIIKCNLHPFLQTHAYLIQNPYYTISDSDGNFSIENIPPGTYEVVAWHPYIAKQRGTITIPQKGEASIDFDFRGEDEKRKLYHDDIEGYRFNTWFDSKEKFYGGPRIDDAVEELQVFCDEDHLCGHYKAREN
ncbi:MAG: tetratricopeptide repeat protein [Nitrospina sp.]|nr:tetratricopeptide repeat protein [Nitrospina sp.]MBT3510122.1 tetratricopeptide repeat protein [Nitrospina sp.]MBT3877367.1 tetratricopeptide repeat protein [Nitrospina sp.]MBT4046762.1 tetratricopeptide repeat protein [Nitrospina sp.]MBT4557516.1 tetratricopeptide repeat protein [Nitrospina sp.]